MLCDIFPLFPAQNLDTVKTVSETLRRKPVCWLWRPCTASRPLPGSYGFLVRSTPILLSGHLTIFAQMITANAVAGNWHAWEPGLTSGCCSSAVLVRNATSYLDSRRLAEKTFYELEA